MQDDLKDKDRVLSCEVTELISISIHIYETVISEIFCSTIFTFQGTGGRGVFRPRQTRQLPRAVDLKGRLLSCQNY